MSPKDPKRQKGRKGKASEPGVLGNLPATRPARIGGRREPRAAQPAPDPPVAAKPEPAKPGTSATPHGTTPAKPRRTSPPAQPPPAMPGGPQPVSAGAPDLEPPPASARATEKPGVMPQSGTELVTTVVQAAGELAHIGLTVGGQVLKRAVSRLPRP